MADPWFWVQRQDMGALPRRSASLAWCDLRHRLLLFGGLGETTTLGDTWEWDGTSWTQVADTGPEARRFASMAATKDGGVLLFGGIGDAGSLLGDTWRWEGTSWVQVEDIGPTPRTGSAMSLDPVSGMVILHSGTADDWNLRDDTWRWDGKSWAQVGDGGPPRWGGVLAWDSTQGALTLFSGLTKHDHPIVHSTRSTWSWDEGKWVQVQDIGPALSYSAGSSIPNGIVWFGGDARGDWTEPMKLVDSTWAWDGALWKQVQDMGPQARSRHVMGLDPIRGQVVLFGGFSESGLLGDTWELEVSTPDQ